MYPIVSHGFFASGSVMELSSNLGQNKLIWPEVQTDRSCNFCLNCNGCRLYYRDHLFVKLSLGIFFLYQFFPITPHHDWTQRYRSPRRRHRRQLAEADDLLPRTPDRSPRLQLHLLLHHQRRPRGCQGSQVLKSIVGYCLPVGLSRGHSR